jgi:hypothetical protein
MVLLWRGQQTFAELAIVARAGLNWSSGVAMKIRTYLLTLLALVLCLPTLNGHGEQNGLRKLMQRKLKASQKVLEGIALSDFGMIGENADELVQVSKATEWRALQTPMYELLSNEFRRNAETLGRMAKERNLDGATLTYLDLTMTCVKCHKHVREVRMTRHDRRGNDSIMRSGLAVVPEYGRQGIEE